MGERDLELDRTVDERRGVADGETPRQIRQYEVIRLLGQGGMGQVYLARDTRLGRLVALKLLSGGAEADTRRALEEARATARCNHENIVVIHEADEHRGRPYIVLEYLEGVTLRGLSRGRRFAPGRVVELMVPVVRALSRAHAFGLVHRDLKPENVFVTDAGTVKVLDFGLAVRVDDRPGAMGTGRPSGTLPYMAPEQLWQRGVDARTDLWAVGVMLFELVAGEHPLAPVTAQRLMGAAALLDQPMPGIGARAAELPARLERAIDRCLRKRPEERFASAQELLDELEPLLPQRAGRALGADESPYPGLTAFQESDADRFFGRAPDIARVRASLRERALVGVVGPSGVGKSSLVRAGLVPALKAAGEPCDVLTLRPGPRPLQSLASLIQPLVSSEGGLADRVAEHQALAARLGREPGYLGALLRARAAAGGEQILLFVDQFEELYTLVPDAAERRAFTACLASAADDAATPLRVLVSMRSDFLDRAAEDRGFVHALTRGLVFLQPLGPEALREALVAPADRLGYGFESPAMIDEMLGALTGTPGALPLLQFAAARLWQSRDPRRKLLTEASYRAMGGIAGALASHADRVVAGLSASGQRLVRSLFTRLVTPEGTRAVVGLDELDEIGGAPGEIEALLDRLVAERLLVGQGGGDGEGGAFELAHESLISGWPRLRRWLDEGREDAAYLAQVRAAARQWEQKGRAAGLLWRDEAVEEARRWRARYRGELGGREQAFLDAAFKLAGRAARLRRVAVASTIAFLLAVIGAGAVALSKVRAAERSAVAAAGRAKEEATRARAAEKTVSDQLALIRAEQEAKARAEGQVQKGKEDLRTANLRLEKALGVAQAESQKAREGAEQLKKANSKLEALLQVERARAEKLERERKKISSELR